MAFDTSGIEVGPDGIRRYAGCRATSSPCCADRRAAPGADGGRRARRPVVDVRRSSGTAPAGWPAGCATPACAPGDRVAVQLPNGLDWALAFWGAQLAGAVVVPMNTRLAQPETSTSYWTPAPPTSSARASRCPTASRGSCPTRSTRDVAALFYTSGTTGRPKGAMITHENFLTNVENVIRCRELARDPDQATLISVPLFHVTGCCSQFLTQLALGGTSVVMPRFDAAAFLEPIAEHRITLITSVPTIYELVLRHPDVATTDVSSVRTLSYGGAPIAPDAGAPAARRRSRRPGWATGSG